MALKHLKLHLTRAQEHMKRSVNAHRRDGTFEVGNSVYLKLRPHRQQSVILRINQMLAPLYYGPFQIEEKIEPMVYGLKPTDSFQGTSSFSRLSSKTCYGHPNHKCYLT